MPFGKTWLLYQIITNIFFSLAVLKYSRYYVNTTQNAMSSFQMKDIQPFEYVEDYILPMDESFLQL